MVKASSSGSSSERWHNRAKGRVAGIPKSCWCGDGIVERISGTEENPYRRYYRCSFAYSEKLQNDGHVFKWVDEAFHNEITQLDYQVSVLEEEMMAIKAVVNEREVPSESISEDVLHEFEMSMLRSVEGMIEESSCKMKKIMAMVVVAFVMMVVLLVSFNM